MSGFLNLSDQRIKKQENKSRSSNLELLRIIAMFLIVSCHAVNHCVFQQYGQSINVMNFYNGLTINKILVAFFSPGGSIANNIFFILMGYFIAIGSNRKIVEKISKLILQVYFYAVIAVLLFVIPYVLGIYKYPRLTNGQIAKSLFSLLLPVTSECWWFITTYVIIYSFSNYISVIIKKISKRTFLFVMIFIFILNAFRWTNQGRYNIFFDSIQSVLLGCYFGLYLNKIEMNKFPLIICLMVISTILLCFVNLYSKIQIELNSDIMKRFIIRIFEEFGRNLSILVASLLFLLFNTLEFNNRVVNKVASTTFGVYLFHASPFAIYFLFDYLLDLNRVYTKWYFIFALFILNAVIFLVTFVLEYIRNKLPLKNKLENLFKRVQL